MKLLILSIIGVFIIGLPAYAQEAWFEAAEACAVDMSVTNSTVSEARNIPAQDVGLDTEGNSLATTPDIPIIETLDGTDGDGIVAGNPSGPPPATPVSLGGDSKYTGGKKR